MLLNMLFGYRYFYKDKFIIINMKTLDKSMENTEKPDWKQWLPVYGVYKAMKDLVDRKPSIVDFGDKSTYFSSMVYHGAFTFTPVLYGLVELLK